MKTIIKDYLSKRRDRPQGYLWSLKEDNQLAINNNIQSKHRNKYHFKQIKYKVQVT